MKQIIFGLLSTLMIVFVLMILMTTYGRNLRQTETEHSLAEAIDDSLAYVMNEENYTIENQDAFVADFLQMLLVQLNSTSDVNVSILEANMEYGILSVEIVQTYNHPNGNKGTVSEVRTVIFDKKAKEAEPEKRTVGFYYAYEGELYKEYIVEKGNVCPVPPPPTVEGKTFKHWFMYEGGYPGEMHNVSVTGTGGKRNVLGIDSTNTYKTENNTKLFAVYE